MTSSAPPGNAPDVAPPVVRPPVGFSPSGWVQEPSPSKSAFVLGLIAVLVGCATAPRVEIAPRSPVDAAALDRAVERFYTATSAVDLRRAVAEAKTAGPSSAKYHELAAELAMFDAAPHERFLHLVSALSDASNDAARLHLELLTGVAWTTEERRVARGLLESLYASHPNPEVRAGAAAQLALISHHEGELGASERWLARTGQELPFAIVGAWDNDQGKGFDSELPPETVLSFSARYDGVLGEIAWRVNPPREYGTGDLNLGGLLYPNQWALGFASAAIEARSATKAELRLRTSSPVRVYVNGKPIFEVRDVGNRAFDQLILPIELPAGRSRVLIKTAAERGGWRIGARLTCNGLDCDGVRALPPETEFATPEVGAPASISEHVLIETRIVGTEGVIRKAAHAVLWSRVMGLFGPAVALSDAYLAAATRSLYGGYFLAVSLWDRGERDRTADLVDTLDRIAGAELPVFALQHARFLQQEGLARKARRTVTSLLERRPELAEAHRLMALMFEKEGWREDQCAELDEAERLRPGLLEVEHARAECLESLGFRGEAREIRQRIVERLPFDSTALSELASDAENSGRLEEAIRYSKVLARAFPAMPWTWLRLGETRRKLGDANGARAELERARELWPDGPRPHEALGTLAYQTGDRTQAIVDWQIALTKNPEDEKLSNRLAYLAPAGREAWERDMPSEDDVEAHVAARSTTKPVAGANVIDLLDHQVTRINADGSSNHYVTIISHALNEAGRDQITEQQIPPGGRFRILHAFAVDPNGRRIQASSIRGRSIRYRGLSVGSTVVLQFRLDVGSRPYLARHYAEDWWFQGPSSQRRISEWIIWAPKSAAFHESLVGQDQRCPDAEDGAEVKGCFDVKRTRDELGAEQRVAWRAEGVPPLVGEPGMPPPSESLFHLSMSTVPSWDDYLKWEVALLEDVFRESPELNATADRILAGAQTAEEKVERIQTYLMQEVRYQQDYEDTIAGVKPHAAPVVIERAYGDCKDKAVLFIALARRAGIDVHYALLKTRTAGKLDRDVPMQQFNHAIVYVPAQEGISEGRFYDPTADMLDVDVLRDDDPGVISLVLNPKTKKHAFVEIPYQPSTAHVQRFESTVEIDADGRGVGQLAISSRGRFGQMIRNLARNEKQLAQGAQYFMGTLFSGARVHEQRALEAQNLSKPARLEIAFEAPAIGRIEGNELRVAMPPVWAPQSTFQLAERRFPLVLGAPYALEWYGELVLPEGASLRRVPEAAKVDAKCFGFERTYAVAGRRVTVVQRFEAKCERISVGEYEAHRKASEEVTRASREEIVAVMGKAI